jgi:Domain of unknown function (DUF222)/HNH endonuclease
MAAIGADVGTKNGRLTAITHHLNAAMSLARDYVEAVDGSELGEVLILIREAGIDPLESVFAAGLRRFDKSGEYAADGAVGIVGWLRWKCKLTAGAAIERVTIARQVDQLPRTEQAFASGTLGYQHVAALARTAEHLGAAAVRKEERNLLRAAETMDPGQFTGVVKNLEHRVDAAAALSEANRAHDRRYLHIGEPVDGLARIDGVLEVEDVAKLRTAMNPYMKPLKDDKRTPGQRAADALIEACSASRRADGAGPRPQLIIRASLDTLAGTPGAPAGELEWGGTIPAATVQRLACDSVITRIAGRGELDAEIRHASRSIPPATRRALVARDRHCVFPGCDRPPSWCNGHHIIWWSQHGATSLENLALLCRHHHRAVHEEGWTIRRQPDGRFHVTPPPRKVVARNRSS